MVTPPFFAGLIITLKWILCQFGICFKLHHIQDRIGNRLSIAYNPNDSHLIDTVSDETSGRLLKFSYTDGFLNSIRLFLGNVDAGIRVTYSHDEHGNLTSALYVDGSGYVYEYNDIDSNPTVAPFINNLTLGNGILVEYLFDQQYRMSASLAIGVQELGYGYDPVGNVTQISNTLEPANDMAFGYDDLYRLADAEGVFGAIGFGNDGNVACFA